MSPLNLTVLTLCSVLPVTRKAIFDADLTGLTGLTGSHAHATVCILFLFI